MRRVESKRPRWTLYVPKIADMGWRRHFHALSAPEHGPIVEDVNQGRHHATSRTASSTASVALPARRQASLGGHVAAALGSSHSGGLLPVKAPGQGARCFIWRDTGGLSCGLWATGGACVIAYSDLYPDAEAG